jgi:hypothetical protein
MKTVTKTTRRILDFKTLKYSLQLRLKAKSKNEHLRKDTVAAPTIKVKRPLN